MNPNPADETPQDAPANPDDFNDGTEQQPGSEAAPIDYEKKFSESSREALRLLEEGKAKDAEIERLRVLAEQGKDNEGLYPGFEELDEDAQKNLVEYTENVKRGVKDDLMKDPSIAYGRKLYAENKFDSALSNLITEFPELKDSKEDFKSKYFNPDNVPENLSEVLADLAKVHLFDKAREIGATEERTKADRIDMERAKGGPRTVATHRTIEEWQQIARNPSEFAKLSKDYDADMASGNLAE